MTLTTALNASTQRSRTGRWAGLAGRLENAGGSGRPFVFLHGLTFDRQMWNPALEALPARSPGLALDLPGHGDSTALGRHHLEDVAQAVHEAVLDAGFDSPVLVGHSMGGLLATLYAARYPAAGVVNADQPLGPPAAFVRAARSLEARFRGPGFAEVWAGYQASMHLELVPAAARPLLRAGERASQDVLLTYWAELFELEVQEVVDLTDEMLAAVSATGVPYIAVYGDPITPEVRAWVAQRLPAAEIIVWPVGHHFPHLAHPDRFAGVLSIAGRSTGRD